MRRLPRVTDRTSLLLCHLQRTHALTCCSLPPRRSSRPPAGAASAAAVAGLVLSGRVAVRWLRYGEVQTFFGCFDFTTERWISYYRCVRVGRAAVVQCWARPRKCRHTNRNHRAPPAGRRANTQKPTS